MNRLQQQITKMGAVLLFSALVGMACTAPTSQAPAATNDAAVSATPAQDTTTSSAVTTTEQTTETVTETTAADSVVATTSKLNLNTVTEEELRSTIPGFGNRMVREFFEYRPYVSIQQFRREIGKYVDEAQVADYEQYVYVPVNVNESDAATLMQIPGVDQAAADALVAARPYADQAAFLTKLAEVAPSVDQAGAESYLEAQ